MDEHVIDLNSIIKTDKIDLIDEDELTDDEDELTDDEDEDELTDDEDELTDDEDEDEDELTDDEDEDEDELTDDEDEDELTDDDEDEDENLVPATINNIPVNITTDIPNNIPSNSTSDNTSNNISTINNRTTIKTEKIGNGIIADNLGNIALNISCEIATLSLNLGQILKLDIGSNINLPQFPPIVKLKLNQYYIAEGSLVLINGKVGIKIISINHNAVHKT